MMRFLKIAIVVSTLAAFGCASMVKRSRPALRSALARAVVGGVIGAATGSHNQREKVAIGAATGALVGGLIGNRIGAYMDKQEQDLRNAMASTISQNNATIQRNNEQMLTATF